MVVVLDANHFREFAHGTVLGTALKSRVLEREASVFSCIVTAEESLNGWISLVRRARAGRAQVHGYGLLLQTISVLAQLSILPFDDDAASVFNDLEKLRLRVGTMDLKIAAICLAHDATLLTRNLVDFEKVPGLKVENWLD